jgi:hypothetical protein
MHRMAKLAVLGALPLILSACSDRLVRSVVVHDGHVEQQTITVRSGVPFTLTASAIDSPSVSVSAPEIGLAPIAVPNTQAPPQKPGQSLTSDDIDKVRLDLGPVAPGNYRITVVTGDTVHSVPLVAE